MDASTLAGLDAFDLFDAEAARLDRFFSWLEPTAWSTPSRCEGWSIKDVLAHLAGEELYNHACLNGDVTGFFALLRREGLGDGFGGFNDWCVRQRRNRPVGEVLDEWRTANGETRRRMRQLGLEGTLETSIGPYPAGLQALHYASECATHADDVGAPVEPDEEPGRTEWRARFGRFALAEQNSPAIVEEVRGAYRVSVGQHVAELPAADFVAATVARLPKEHPLPPPLRQALACLA